jgi:hypothetical protein
MTSTRRRHAAVIAAAIAVYSWAPLHAQNRDFIWKASRGQSVVYLSGRCIF